MAWEHKGRGWTTHVAFDGTQRILAPDVFLCSSLSLTGGRR